jgi:hypothetical protein
VVVRVGVGAVGVDAEHSEDRPRPVESFTGSGPDRGEPGPQRLGHLGDPVRGGLGLDGDERQVVGQHVVQLPRDAGPLLQHRPAGPVVLVQLPLAVEPAGEQAPGPDESADEY